MIYRPDIQLICINKHYPPVVMGKISPSFFERIKTTLEQLEAFRVGMVAKVSAVLQSGDPEQFAALAVEFLTPEEEKARAEKLAKVEALKAEAAAIEAELGIE